MFAIAHLSDPHLPLPAAPFRALLCKRALGWQSWHRRRKAIHRPEVLHALVEDIRQAGPDHWVVTGDLANISLPEEFRRARQWLDDIGPPDMVTVIPGNHDHYVPLASPGGLDLWRDYMRGDGCDAVEFPTLRRRGDIAIVGVNTARPMPWWAAAGEIGEPQLAALRQRLLDLGEEGVFRLVLIHHPPADAIGGRRKALWDGAAFRRTIAETGAELVLHGHDHVPRLQTLAGPRAAVPVLSVPSASAAAKAHGHGAAWNLYRIARDGRGWRVDVTVRGLSGGAGALSTLGRFELRVDQ